MGAYESRLQELGLSAIRYGRTLEQHGEDPAGIDAGAELRESALAFYETAKRSRRIPREVN